MAKKSRPQLPAVILERLPEKHGIYRELLEHIQLMIVNDRRRVYLLGKDLFRLREACTSNRNVAFWDWLETKGLDHPEVLGWSEKRIRRSIRLYERLHPVEEFLDQIQMRVQYFIADHAVNDNWLPLMRQLLMDGRTLSVDNFSTEVDPQIEMSYMSHGGTSGEDEMSHGGTSEEDEMSHGGTFSENNATPPDRRVPKLQRSPETTQKSGGNGHVSHGELLEADDDDHSTQSGGSNGSPESSAHESGFSRSGSRNGKPIERTVIRAQVAHDASEHIHDAIKTIKRACDQYGFQGRGRWEEAWFSRFRGGCEEALQALQEWEKVPLAETR